MNLVISQMLARLNYGTPLRYQNLNFIPILFESDDEFSYLTLAEAFTTGKFEVTEVSESGTVGELMFVNRSNERVLVLDGEELVGAKQNRVLNTSVLLAPHSRTIVPVSCTEQGRWSYRYREFSDSGAIMAKHARHSKLASVSAGLAAGIGATSDQGLVWREIELLHERLGTSSPTGAMKDAYEVRRRASEAASGHLPLSMGQCGFLTFRGDQPIGIEFVSRVQAYAKLHDRLIESYLLDEILVTPEHGRSDAHIDIAAFLRELADLEEAQFGAIGLGSTFRYRGTTFCGAALVHDDHVLHFFCTRGDESRR